MSKNILYKLFGVGRVPRKHQALLESETIVILDEGIKGLFVTKDFKSPNKRFVNRREGFLGSIVVTKTRVMCHTFWRQQINLSVNDSRLTLLHTELISPETIAISFDSYLFNKECEGIIEFQFKTDKAQEIFDALGFLGVKQGKLLD